MPGSSEYASFSWSTGAGTAVVVYQLGVRPVAPVRTRNLLLLDVFTGLSTPGGVAMTVYEFKNYNCRRELHTESKGKRQFRHVTGLW